MEGNACVQYSHYCKRMEMAMPTTIAMGPTGIRLRGRGLTLIRGLNLYRESLENYYLSTTIHAPWGPPACSKEATDGNDIDAGTRRRGSIGIARKQG